MLRVKSFENNFEYLEIQNNSASAKIALNGAHIFEYIPTKKENLLWLSKLSKFENGVAIRGGIPICWPSFGMNNPQLTQHGFARTSLFKLVSHTEINEHTTQVILALDSSSLTREVWNFHFNLQVKFTITDSLSVELTTTNLDTKEFVLTQALHTYFNVSDISNVIIEGLNNKPYLDALLNTQSRWHGDIRFTQEFDAVFQEVDKTTFLRDKDKKVQITTQGSASTVIWNPWIDKCSIMSSMSANDYKEFVCIESANAYEDFKRLKPNDSYTLKATFKTL